MKREEILAKWDRMTPRERDALVAEYVMGFKIESPWAEECTIWDGREVRYFEPSQDISAAMEVAHVVKEKAQAHISIELFYNSRIDGRVMIQDMEDKEDTILPFGEKQKAGFPKTLTEAMAKAFLLAVIDNDS